MATARKMVGIRMRPDQKSRLQELAAQEAVKMGRPVPVSEMVVLLVDRAYRSFQMNALRRRRKAPSTK
jgi:hypothetical protein